MSRSRSPNSARRCLAYESQSLLTGEAVHPEVRAEIERIAKMAPGVVGTNQVLTMHFGTHEVLAALSLDFDDRRSAADVGFLCPLTSSCLPRRRQRIGPRLFAASRIGVRGRVDTGRMTSTTTGSTTTASARPPASPTV